METEQEVIGAMLAIILRGKAGFNVFNYNGSNERQPHKIFKTPLTDNDQGIIKSFNEKIDRKDESIFPSGAYEKMLIELFHQETEELVPIYKEQSHQALKFLGGDFFKLEHFTDRRTYKYFCRDFFEKHSKKESQKFKTLFKDYFGSNTWLGHLASLETAINVWYNEKSIMVPISACGERIKLKPSFGDKIVSYSMDIFTGDTKKKEEGIIIIHDLAIKDYFGIMPIYNLLYIMQNDPNKIFRKLCKSMGWKTLDDQDKRKDGQFGLQINKRVFDPETLLVIDVHERDPLGWTESEFDPKYSHERYRIDEKNKYELKYPHIYPFLVNGVTKFINKIEFKSVKLSPKEIFYVGDNKVKSLSDITEELCTNLGLAEDDKKRILRYERSKRDKLKSNLGKKINLTGQKEYINELITCYLTYCCDEIKERTENGKELFDNGTLSELNKETLLLYNLLKIMDNKTGDIDTITKKSYYVNSVVKDKNTDLINIERHLSDLERIGKIRKDSPFEIQEANFALDLAVINYYLKLTKENNNEEYKKILSERFGKMATFYCKNTLPLEKYNFRSFFNRIEKELSSLPSEDN